MLVKKGYQRHSWFTGVRAMSVHAAPFLLPLTSSMIIMFITIDWSGKLSGMDLGELTSRDGFESRGIT